MFVVPFYIRPSPKSLIQWSLQPIVLFLDSQGRQICKTDAPLDWLAENGFHTKTTWTQGQTVYAEIDTQQTAVKEYYTFEELTTEQQKGTQECWRTFYVLTGESTHHWNECLEEPFKECIDSIQMHRSKSE
jgi:hypothetical protein